MEPVTKTMEDMVLENQALRQSKAELEMNLQKAQKMLSGSQERNMRLSDCLNTMEREVGNLLKHLIDSGTLHDDDTEWDFLKETLSGIMDDPRVRTTDVEVEITLKTRATVNTTASRHVSIDLVRDAVREQMQREIDGLSSIEWRAEQVNPLRDEEVTIHMSTEFTLGDTDVTIDILDVSEWD